jgi:hypothetical protein
MIGVILLLLQVVSSLIQPAKASGSSWDEYWHAGIYESYPGYPENVSNTITVYNDDGSQWVKIALVVSVYQYEPYVDDDIVVLRVGLYYDSFADGVLPCPADAVTICVQKDTEGSNFYDQAMEVRYSGARLGFAQGSGLDQSSWLDSTQDDREWWALGVLSFAAGLFCEPVDVVTDLIFLASSWAPQEGPDYDNADWLDYGLYSWWENPGYDFGYDNPVRQYAFNTIEWIQHKVNPSTHFGIKVWAKVIPRQPTLLPPEIDTPPVYLRIHRSHTLSISTTSGGNTDPAPGTYAYSYGSSVTVTASPYSGHRFDYWILDGMEEDNNPITVTMNSNHNLTAYFSIWGGGCPTLFVWSGTDYADEGILDIHADSDVTVRHEIENPFDLEDGGYGVQLRELDNFTSHIDQVRLYAVDDEGEEYLCPLTHAYHSELDNVKHMLRFDDDTRVDLKPTERIDLRFGPPECQIEHFIFEINGYNPKPLEEAW